MRLDAVLVCNHQYPFVLAETDINFLIEEVVSEAYEIENIYCCIQFCNDLSHPTRGRG